MSVATGAYAAAFAAPRRGPLLLPPVVLLPFVLVSFAANSLTTRHVVSDRLLDAGLLSAVRFIVGAVVLVGIAVVRRERPAIGRANLWPALWLGVYAVCISYGYRSIGAAEGTFVFYASVLLTLIAHDLITGSAVPVRRGFGAAVSLGGSGVETTERPVALASRRGRSCCRHWPFRCRWPLVRRC